VISSERTARLLPWRQHLLRERAGPAAAASRTARAGAPSSRTACAIRSDTVWSSWEWTVGWWGWRRSGTPARPTPSPAYFYDNRVLDIAASLRPHSEASSRSPRQLGVSGDGRAPRRGLGTRHGLARHGTQEALLQASTFIQAIQERQDLKVACPEEIALKMGYLTRRRRPPGRRAHVQERVRTVLLRLASEVEPKLPPADDA